MASRMMFFVLSAVAIVLFFSLAGIGIGNDFVTNFYGLTDGTMTASDFFIFLFSSGSGALFLSSITTAITVSFFSRNSVENFIVLGIIVGVFVMLCGVFVSVINTSQNCVIVGGVQSCTSWAEEWGWAASSIRIVFSLYLLGYIVTMIEFFRGNV